MDEFDDYIEDDFDDWSENESSMIECPNCGESIYEESEQCPNCFEYIVSGVTTATSNVTKIVIWLVIISLALPAIIVVLNLL